LGSFFSVIHVANSVNYGCSSSVYRNEAPADARQAQLPLRGMKASAGGLSAMGCLATDLYAERKAVSIDYPSRPS